MAAPHPEPKAHDKPLHEVYSAQALAKLYDVNLFADIRHDPGAVEALAHIMTSRLYQRGENITEEHGNGTEMFILMDGEASVYKRTPQGDEYKVAIFDGAKAVAFGESGLIDADTRSATIRAETDCQCVVLERNAFEKYSNAYPHWALPIYRRIAQSVMKRMKRTNDDMLLLYNALVAEIRGQ